MRTQALILLGEPGAGKGTQGRELSKHFGVPQISTGDILRDAIKNKTPLGLAAKAKMEAGDLVPDDVMCGIVEARISQPDCQQGFILDGFPRTLPQGEFLGRLLRTQGRGDPLVLNIGVPPEVVMKRLIGRRTCSVCGQIYNIYLNPPMKEGVCDKDGGKLVERPDDNEETIRQRLFEYENQTSPLVVYYRRKNLLHDVDGSRSSETIAKELFDFLRNS